MNNTDATQIKKYFLQQAELDIPDYFFSSKISDMERRPGFIRKDIHKKKQQSDILPNEDTFAKKRAALVELYYAFKQCKGCSLYSTRTNMVFGAGIANASLMIIGEAPGFEEDKQGKPFVGKAGMLLTKMLAAIHIERENNVFITNILKCRPPDNRNPNKQEEIACLPLLKKQIEIIKPKAILLLGRIAAQALLNITDSVAKIRAESHTYTTIPVVVTYHPAALLRYSAYKKPAWEDLQKLQKLLH